jgi:uncharacterized protein (DUF1330 family)
MTAYFILTHTITDIETYRSEYIPQVLPFIAKHGGEIVVASPETEPLQGNPEKGVVVLRFPSEEAVRAFVNDPSTSRPKSFVLQRQLTQMPYSHLSFRCPGANRGGS